MDPITEFASFEGRNYTATTRRVYLGAAKTALKLVGKTHDGCESYAELLETLREKRTQGILPKRLRMAPFLEFLESKLPANVRDSPDLEPVRTWMLERIEAETKAARKVSIPIRRDLARLEALCVAAERNSPRRWPKKRARGDPTPERDLRSCYGIRRSRAKASPWPCFTGTPGGSGWAGPSRAASTGRPARTAIFYSLIP